MLELLVPFLMHIIITKEYGFIHYDIAGQITEYNLGALLGIGGAMIGCAILSFILGFVGAKYSAIAGKGLADELRKDEFKKIQNFSFKNLDSIPQSSLITRLTTDSLIISDACTRTLRPILRAPISLIFSMILAFIISPLLACVFLVILPILAFSLAWLLRKVKPKFRFMQKALDKLNRITQESLIAIKTIKAYVKEDYEALKFNEANVELKDLSTSAFTLNSFSQSIMQLSNYVTSICLIIFGAMFLNKGMLKDVSEIATCLTYTSQLLASLNMAASVMMIFNRSNASFMRIIEILNTENEPRPEPIEGLEIKSGNIEFNDVSFKYHEEASKNILSNINFKIDDGEFIGIVGQTGSGKTSLINLIMNFYNPTSGEIKLDGHNIYDYLPSEIHSKIAISFQKATIFSGTVKYNLTLGNPNAIDEEIIKACKIAECYDFIMNKLENGFDTQISQSGLNLSGGQRQRIAIDRALIQNPKILILDDSFSALDRITTNKVKENLKSLTGMTKIIISQKIAALEECDRIIVLNEGQVNNIGTHEELIQVDPIYKEINDIQKRGLAQ